jgi:EmrB/QacA subfamily drug resistance transporter
MTLSLTILTSAFPPERRGAVVGAWGAIGGLAVASGPVVGGGITQGIDWHWIFWLNVPIGALALALSLRRLPESRGPDVRLDLPGLSLSAAGATLLIWGLVRTGTSGWSDPATLVALACALAILAGLIAWERRARYPMLPPRLFARRSFRAASAAAFLMMATIMAAAFLIAQYFQIDLGHSPLSTGLRILPWTATPTLIVPLAGLLSDRVGTRPLIVTGLLLQAVGLAWFATEATAAAGYGSLIGPLIVAGIGISMAIPTAPTAALSAVAAQDIGKASGTTSTLQRFGGAFGVAVATAVFTAHGNLTSPAGFDAGFRPALAVAAGISLAGALSALFIAGRRQSEPEAIAPAAIPAAAATSS